MAEFYRSFTPELEVRAASKGGDGRTIYGIAVPYGRAQVIDDHLTEQFARGAFNHQLNAAHRVYFAREHMQLGGTLIGKTVDLQDDAAGLVGQWRVSRTPMGDETLELVKDGALRDLSIGFEERQNRSLAGGITERVTANLREVSVVLEGAYGEGAVVAGVRSLNPCPHGPQCPQCAAARVVGTPHLDSVRSGVLRDLEALRLRIS